MTLFLGVSPSYVREGGPKPNASWRDDARGVVDSSGRRLVQSGSLVVIGTQWKRAGPLARISRSVE
jgi:hypothetical protein